MSFNWSFLHVVVAVILTLFGALCEASSLKNTVNVLTRYECLRSPEIISAVKNSCNVDVSYDVCYSSGECLRRASIIADFYYYDIIIFPSDIYGLIKRKIERKNSSLNKVVEKYNNVIKDHYLSHVYPSNVVYFMLSLYGFIWNPQVIDLLASDSISSMFEKAKNNIVVVGNNPIEIRELIDNKHKLSRSLLAKAFGKTIQVADIHLTSIDNKLYDKKNFAFAFRQSGCALSGIKSAKNRELTFLMHPELSYIFPDLLAELNGRPETQCVARILASKKILDIVQKKTYYLSPYGTYSSVDDSTFQHVYKQLFANIHKIRWLDSITALYWTELRTVWAKIQLLPQVMKDSTIILNSN